MISKTLKFIFIHIPKTGGNSLQWYLRECSDHKVIRRGNVLGPTDGIDLVGLLKHKKKYNNNTFFKFCIVRNPYDRALSMFFFENPNIKTYDKTKFINFINKTKGSQYQHRFLTDPTIHKIHFENMIEELKQLDIFKNTKYTFEDYPRLNSSINFNLNWEELYDKEVKDLVYKTFKKDFQVCGYPQ